MLGGALSSSAKPLSTGFCLPQAGRTWEEMPIPWFPGTAYERAKQRALKVSLGASSLFSVELRLWACPPVLAQTPLLPPLGFFLGRCSQAVLLGQVRRCCPGAGRPPLSEGLSKSSPGRSGRSQPGLQTSAVASGPASSRRLHVGTQGSGAFPGCEYSDTRHLATVSCAQFPPMWAFLGSCPHSPSTAHGLTPRAPCWGRPEMESLQRRPGPLRS